jgi:folate-binding protein YgfZ
MFSATAYRTVREHVAFLDRSDRGLIVVSGSDRATYLQGLLTNDIVGLKSGTGCYAAYLTPQGRMITDLFVYELGDVMLLALPRPQKDVVLAKLDQLVFSEDVQLGDVTETFLATAIVGPSAPATLANILGLAADDLRTMPEHGNLRAAFEDRPMILTRTKDTGVMGFDVYVESAKADVFRIALVSNGIQNLDPETAEVVRIEAGIPKFNQDMDEDTIPLEAGIESRAISFSKGCYVGQEVIIRVLHRGHGRVARKLVGLVVEGETSPSIDARVMSNNREIGNVTSAAVSPTLKKPIALAYLHRDFLAEGTAVTIDGVEALVERLPFVKTEQ